MQGRNGNRSRACATNVLEDFIIVAINHIVRDDGGKHADATVALDCKDTTLNINEILLSEQLFWLGHLARDNVCVETLADILDNTIASFANFATDALSL